MQQLNCKIITTIALFYARISLDISHKKEYTDATVQKVVAKIFDLNLIKLRILRSYLKLTRKLVAGPRKKEAFFYTI